MSGILGKRPMILLTVGTQLPFDRLVKAVDEIAPSLNEEIFGQIGKEGYRPKNLEYCEEMAPREFERRLGLARVILSHAGIGTMLTARRIGKPIILFPRQAKFGEHRNDHQIATSKQMEGRPGIYVAYDILDSTTVALTAFKSGFILIPGTELRCKQCVFFSKIFILLRRKPFKS